MTKLKNRIINGLFASGFGQAVTIFSQLAGVPLFLYFWGAEKYGEWLILSAVPAYLAMSDFGFSSVAGNDMTMNVATGQREPAVKIFQSILVVILLAAVVSGAVVVAVIILQMMHGLLPVKHISGIEIATVIAVLWIQVIVGQIGGALGAGYRCDGNFAIGMFYSNVMRLGEFLASVASLLAGGGFIAIVLSMLAVRIIGTYVIAIDMRRRSPWLLIGLSQSSWAEIRRLMRPALAFMAFPLGHAINLQGFALIVGSLMGGSAVAVFSIYRTLTRLPWQMMNMINISVWPELSRSFGEGNIEQVRKLHRLSVAFSFWGVLVTLAFLYFLSTPFIKFWTSGQIPAQQALLLMLELVVLANSLWSTSSMVAVSSNRHENIALIYMASSIFALGLSILLSEYYGLLGMAISLLVIDMTMIYFVLQQSMRMTNDRLMQFIFSIIVFPANLLQIVKQRLLRSAP